uniref:K Homology domain-containing protein n=1 Tax=Alexandrium monilatum TaxID=311494 RepID=A0A7S4VGV0_9DINO
MCSPLGSALVSQAEKSGTSAGDCGSSYSGKRYNDGYEAPERPVKFGRPEKEQPPPAPAVFKFLAPEALANALEAFSAIVGEAAGGELDLTSSGDLFPGTSSRTACLISDNKEGIMEGMRKVLTIVVQCGECASNRPGEFQLTTIMPAKSCAMLIGVKGHNIKDLVKTSGAHVHVEGEAVGFTTGTGPGGDKVVHIKGSYVGLESAITRLVECVLEFQDQPWFPDWVVRSNAERMEDDDGKARSARMAKLSLAGRAGSSSGDMGCDEMADMAAMASMCSMMMPMQCMQMMAMNSMMPFLSMCMPFMGVGMGAGDGGLPMLADASDAGSGPGARGGGMEGGMGGMGCMPGMGGMAGMSGMGGMGGMGAGMGGMGGSCSGPSSTPGPKVEEVAEDDANEVD